jgi:hypothetical protein
MITPSVTLAEAAKSVERMLPVPEIPESQQNPITWEMLDKMPLGPITTFGPKKAEFVEQFDPEDFLDEADSELELDAASEMVASMIEACLPEMKDVEPEPSLQDEVWKLCAGYDPARYLITHLKELERKGNAGFLIEAILGEAAELVFACEDGEEYRTQLIDAVKAIITGANSTELKPADAYRAYVRSLRLITKAAGLKQFHAKAKCAIRELTLDTTLPLSELDTPDWIDGYTGEVDGMIEFLNLPSDVGSDPDYSEGFNAIDEEEEFFDEWDVRPDPVWMQAQNDTHASPEFFDLQERMEDSLQGCRNALSAILFERKERAGNELADLAQASAKFSKIPHEKLFKAARQTVTYPHEQEFPALKWTSYDLYKEFKETVQAMRAHIFDTQNEFEASYEAKRFINALQFEAEDHAAPQDLAILFLKLQNGLYFRAIDENEVIVAYPAVTDVKLVGCTLEDYLLENADAILEDMNDGGLAIRSTDMQQIEDFCEETLKTLVVQQTGKEITSSPVFLDAYYRCMFDARTISNGKRNLALEAGWDAWRQQTNPLANHAFHAALKAGGTNPEAMKSFWKVVNNYKDNRIVSIRPSGLVLSSGRQIDYHIAQIKLAANELPLSTQEKARLRDLLTSHKWGGRFAATL